jgi:L-rhamnose mutarotase
VAAETEFRAFRMTLHPGQAAEYRRRHDALWPELRDALYDAGIQSYRIYLDEPSGALFAVMEVARENGLDALPGLDVMQRWWAMMADIMATNPDHSPQEVALAPMFDLDRR